MRGSTMVKLLVPAGLLTLSACSDTASPNARMATLSFSTRAPTAAIAGARAANFDVTVTSGANTVVITKAQVVVRSIKLKKSETTECADNESNESGENQHEDDCDELKLGPLLVDLPLTADAVTAVSATIPEGTYREIEFKIHKPSDNAKDAEFVTANPAFATISIRVEGTYNGTPFVYTSDISEKVELEFDTPMVINADNQNVTIQFDLRSWFKVGGEVINPTTANDGGANRNAVRQNIRASLHAVEDDNRDGDDDHGHHDP